MPKKQIACDLADFWLAQTDKMASHGNTKIGRTMNLSLLPAVTCPAGVPCCKKCYAMKAMKQYPATMKRWYTNTCLWQQDPVAFEHGLDALISKQKPKYFRWHVAGDIPDRNYMAMMMRLAVMHPETHFLAFTKHYEMLSFCGRRTCPANLKLVMSGWPGYRTELFEKIARVYPTSYIRTKDGLAVIPEGCKECPGACATCRLCWHLKPGQGVVFNEH